MQKKILVSLTLTYLTAFLLAVPTVFEAKSAETQIGISKVWKH